MLCVVYSIRIWKRSTSQSAYVVRSIPIQYQHTPQLLAQSKHKRRTCVFITNIIRLLPRCGCCCFRPRNLCTHVYLNYYWYWNIFQLIISTEFITCGMRYVLRHASVFNRSWSLWNSIMDILDDKAIAVLPSSSLPFLSIRWVINRRISDFNQ